MARKYDIEVDQGSKFELTVSVTIHGALVDISGWTARLQIRGDRRLDSPVLATLVSSGIGAELTVVGPSAQVQIDMHGATSLGWDWDYGQYDLTVYEPGGEPHRVLQGKVTVNHIVTAAS